LFLRRDGKIKRRESAVKNAARRQAENRRQQREADFYDFL
jgi:hypothetical protein